MTEALGKRELAGTPLAHRNLVPAEPSDDAREHFAGLPDEDRIRILALVRSLTLCRTAELYPAGFRSVLRPAARR